MINWAFTCTENVHKECNHKLVTTLGQLVKKKNENKMFLKCSAINCYR